LSTTVGRPDTGGTGPLLGGGGTDDDVGGAATLLGGGAGWVVCRWVVRTGRVGVGAGGDELGVVRVTTGCGVWLARGAFVPVDEQAASSM
jgi:hypothetical protein